MRLEELVSISNKKLKDMHMVELINLHKKLDKILEAAESALLKVNEAIENG